MNLKKLSLTFTKTLGHLALFYGDWVFVYTSRNCGIRTTRTITTWTKFRTTRTRVKNGFFDHSDQLKDNLDQYLNKCLMID